ncbi:MAG: molybdopterin molybdotransferase [Micromonosporaceae bacterium]|nr:molybdopterin molybdotransferase [Micromonosporaceae bacterium]
MAHADGLTLASPLVTLTDLPAFPTSSVDGWAVRGPAPWRIVGRVLAGSVAPPLTGAGTRPGTGSGTAPETGSETGSGTAPETGSGTGPATGPATVEETGGGTCVEIATGAMVPVGTEHVVRIEESEVDGQFVTGVPRPVREWRVPGEEAHLGEELLAAGTAVTPAVIGLAAACGYDTLRVRPAPTAAALVFGDELLTAGPPAGGRIRDALGPSVPSWLRRVGAVVDAPIGPVKDTLAAHVEAIRAALDTGVDLVCTTGGTMHGPVDHLHPTLAELGATYVVNTVAVRPGFPMLIAALPGGRFVAGLPGNPLSAVVALVSLVEPLIAGLRGRPLPVLPTVTLGVDLPGRGDFTHLVPVRIVAGLAHPVSHAGSSMLRGLARSAGFAVVRSGHDATAGETVPLLPLPILDGERA